MSLHFSFKSVLEGFEPASRSRQVTALPLHPGKANQGSSEPRQVPAESRPEATIAMAIVAGTVVEFSIYWGVGFWSEDLFSPIVLAFCGSIGTISAIVSRK